MTHTVLIKEKEQLTHDVVRLRVEKPNGYSFRPGQATEVAIDRNGWRDEKRPFTFTSLNDWNDLEFTIKIYHDHNGVTEQIGTLETGDKLLIEDPWGAIEYKSAGSFIAGGAGITPFIAIFRDLKSRESLEGNTLYFSNKTERDIILREELEQMDGLNCVLTVTDQPDSTLSQRMIDASFLGDHVSAFDQNFYVCGPPPMVEAVEQALMELGANKQDIVTEES